MNIKMQKVYPKFELGKEVYVVLGPGHTCQGRVTAYHSLVIDNHDDSLWVLPHAVRLDTFTITDYFDDIEDDAVPWCYLADNGETVRRWSESVSVEFSDEDWFKAIGKRPTFEEIKKAAEEKTFDSEDSLEESELGSCCAGIADVRTILIKCQENKGLIVWEVEQLQQAINGAGHDMPEDAPILKNILKQLKVEWKESENG